MQDNTQDNTQNDTQNDMEGRPKTDQGEGAEAVRGRIVDIEKGDTFVLKGEDGDLVTVHLWGTDAPEMDHSYGPAAAIKARSSAHGEEATVEVKRRLPDGSVVGRLYARGRDVGKLLVETGQAWHNTERAPEATELAQLQRQAREEERGIWSSEHSMPP